MLDVGTANGPQTLVLHYPNGGFGAYVALSYCWGGPISQKTTSENVAQYQQSISLDILPATFKDAVAFTRGVGLRYLWIDALCIIQDSPEDWKSESVKMEQYYKNCELMISVLHAENSDSGIFMDRFEGDVIQVPRKLLRESNVISQGSGPLSLRMRELRYFEEYRMSPLIQRGWTLQELVLAPTVVHYGRRQIWWECRSARISECGYYQFVEPTKHATKRVVDLFHSGPDHSNPLFYWYLLVEDFTKRSLTKESDRLPAILGLAQDYQKNVHDIYVHGLWMRDLPFGILWHGGPSTRRTEESALRAPSWSWGSVNGPVHWDGFDFKPGYFFEILDIVPSVRNTHFSYHVTALKIAGRCLEVYYRSEKGGSLRSVNGTVVGGAS